MRRSSSMPVWEQDRVGDVGRGDRTEELAALARARLHLDGLRAELRGDLLGRLTVARLLDLPASPHRLRLRDDALGGAHREPSRHQVVARVAVGDLEQVALLAERLDVFPQHDLHAPAPPVSTSTTSTSTSSTAGAPLTCSTVELDLDVGVAGVVRLLGRTRRHLLAQLTAVTAVATTTLALGHLPDAVGQQRHLACEADRLRHLPLLLGRIAGDAARPDLRPLGHEPTQQVDVLVVDPLDLLGVEDRDLLLLRSTSVGRGALAVAAPVSSPWLPARSLLAGIPGSRSFARHQKGSSPNSS